MWSIDSIDLSKEISSYLGIRGWRGNRRSGVTSQVTKDLDVLLIESKVMSDCDVLLSCLFVCMYGIK